MGALIDGSSKIYVTDESGKEVDVARENRIRGNVQHSGVGAALATGLPSLFMCAAAKIGKSADSDTDPENASATDKAKIEELKTELDGYLIALNITSADNINETVSDAQDKYANKKSAVGMAQKTLDDYTNQHSNSTPKPGDYDSEVQRLQGELQKAKDAESTAKAELDKVIENAQNAYECAQKLANLRQHVISDPYVTESKETLHTFNNERTKFMSATNENDKKAAAQKLYELAALEPNNNTMKNVISLLEKSYQLGCYKNPPVS